ncbi:hypothetical protein VSH64_01325 [Amycolatopsis rhabdoformis]|uniref:DUF7192 domain-containing protein n=1 Tax=Amycolatopsis rhabdoformis TaxID=1448059 RepID=A0ABZ1IA17_9PSEU|nr:hypothetical protein [Amycolatopsis rhabdoformis]WSE30783.1 hypothetical protein VSH64_01325 [Amycolatopsis rhabdoformis]
MLPVHLPPMLSWHEFVGKAAQPPTITRPASRKSGTGWPGASWEEALRLAVDGWPVALENAGITVDELRAGAGLEHQVTELEPAWDVTGSEVDIGAYLSGVPECMVDAVPRPVSRRGKVVTFLIPAAYSNRIGHDVIINRGLALVTLCAAIIDAGHSVEIWSGFTGTLKTRFAQLRTSAVARVISAGEPLDIGRLIFAVAHPAMLRRLWFGVWDAQPEDVAKAVKADAYTTPVDCRADDLPAEVTEPYVFPHLTEQDRQSDDLPTALGWAKGLFGELGLIRR